MKSLLVVALVALIGLASASTQFFTSTDITVLSAEKGEYFFCVPLGVAPTGVYALAAQFVLESADNLLVKFQGAKLDNYLSLPKQLAVHTVELKSSTGSTLPLFNEETFKTHGCVSGVVTSAKPLTKVIVAFMIHDSTEVKQLPESANSCAKFLVDIQTPKVDEKQPKIMIGRRIPFFAIFSLSAGSALLVCAFISCCCMCARRRCKSQECCKNQTVCAYESRDGGNSSEMNVVTEQVPAVQDTTVQAPQPAAGAFYYVPAGAVNGGQYAPMQFVPPTGSSYPGNVQFVAVVPQ